MILQPTHTNLLSRPLTSLSCLLLHPQGCCTNGLIILRMPRQRERPSWELQHLRLPQPQYGCKIPPVPGAVCAKLSLRGSSIADITAESVVVSCVGNILRKRNFCRIFTQLKSSVYVTTVLLVKRLSHNPPAHSSLTSHQSNLLKRLSQPKRVWALHLFLTKSLRHSTHPAVDVALHLSLPRVSIKVLLHCPLPPLR